VNDPTLQSYVLLNSGKAFFPALVAAIEAARVSVSLETYLFDFNGAGGQVALALCAAAKRGIVVRVLVDGIGTPPLSAMWHEQLLTSGVAFVFYKPMGRLGLLTPNHWRRLHRKLCVVDRQVAFCGGINILDDWYDPNHGPLAAPRLDFALQMTGPIAEAIAFHTDQLWRSAGEKSDAGVEGTKTGNAKQYSGQMVLKRTKDAFMRLSDTAKRQRLRKTQKGPDQSSSRLLLRDNLLHRRTIERAYLTAIASAKTEVVLANAYFLPGQSLRLALARAVKRGVRVRVLLQGRYEYFMQFHAARAAYLSLLNAGVEIYEYTPSFLHAKVAVIDPDGAQCWATVGSSNLDPLSLLLAREVNVVITGCGIPLQLFDILVQAMDQDARQVQLIELNRASLWQKCLNRAAYALMRAALFLTGHRY
jgi:cardiolipin synthase